MTGACLLCGAGGGVDRHHVTGRYSPRGVYLDPALTLLLCRACHAQLHAGLRVAHLDWPSGDALAHRLARTAWHLGAVASAGRPVILAPSSALALRGLLLDALPALRPAVMA